MARSNLAQAATGDTASENTDVGSATDAPLIKVKVDIAPEISDQLTGKEILFIYAKATQGPPMPLAVVRQPVAGWPVEVMLSDENAMTPAMTLSKFDKVVVQARISATGNAITQSGDWVGPTRVLEVSAGVQSVSLRIESQLP